MTNQMSTDALELYCRNRAKAKGELTEYDRELLMDVSARLCALQSENEKMDKLITAYCISGLTPDDLPHAAKLVKAEKDGRCVMLPCGPSAFYYQWPRTEKYPSLSRFEGIYINEDGEVFYHTQWKDFNLKDFGKTVFLTRAEAKEALGGGENG